MGLADHLAPRTRNLTINGRRTSVRLEPALWDAVDEICDREACTPKDLFSSIDLKRGAAGLTPAVRLFVVAYFRVAAERQTVSIRGFSEGNDEAVSPIMRAALQSLDA